MEKKQIDKKGEMTSKMLVSTIILVLGVGIILLIYAQFNWTGQIDREVCKESVILRGTLPNIAQSIIPLKCETKKICVRGSKLVGKGECDEMENEKKLTNANVKTLTEVEKLISNEFVDCWSMMGEGHLSLFSDGIMDSFGFTRPYASCVICSRIAFDEETLKEKGIVIDDLDVFEYMNTHKIPGGEESYYDYLSGESPAKIDAKNTINLDGEDIDLTNIEYQEEKVEELAIVFTQISTPTSGEALKSLGYLALGAGGSISFASKVPIVGKLISKGSTKILTNPYVLGAVALAAVAHQGIIIHNRGITAGYCGDVSTGSEAKEGCSVVRIVNYDKAHLSNNVCDIIESIS